MQTRRHAADQENAGFSATLCENAAASKPSGLGNKNHSNGVSTRRVGLGGVGGKASAAQSTTGMQTRRGLKDITNKTEAGAGAGGATGKANGKKPGARVASASVGSGDTGVAAPAAGVNVNLSSASSNSAVAVIAPGPTAVAASATTSTAVQQRPIRTAVRTATDIDLRDADEPLAVTEYVEDLYAFLREREMATKVDRGYMERQPNVNERMRSILIDWLVEVHLKFKLVPDTLYLTVYLIDKYLELEEVRCFAVSHSVFVLFHFSAAFPRPLHSLRAVHILWSHQAQYFFRPRVSPLAFSVCFSHVTSSRWRTCSPLCKLDLTVRKRSWLDILACV